MDWQYDTPPATKRSYDEYTRSPPRIYPPTLAFSMELPADTDQAFYDLPSAPSTSPLVAMPGDPPAPPEERAQPALVQRVGTSLYNVALWTYRVATQVVGGVKRRAIETRVRRPAPTPQEEQREIIRASHRPLRSPRPRPSAGRRHTAGSSPRTPPYATGPNLRTPTRTTGPNLHTPTHTTRPNLTTSDPITGASLDPSTAIDPEYGFEVEFNEAVYWGPIVHELEKRLIAKWGLERAREIFFKYINHQPLTKEEAEVRTPAEIAADRAKELALRTPAEVAEDEAEEAAIAAEAAQAAETGQVDSSLLSSAPSSIEKYRPADMDQYQHVSFSSPLSSAPSSIEKYRPTDLDERKITPFSSPLSSPPASIEVYSTTDLDTCELSTSSAPLPSAPSSIEKSKPARLDNSQPFSSPLSSAPASIEKYSTTGLNKCENTSFSSPLSSAPASIEKYSTTGLDTCENTSFSSPLSSAPASIEKYRPASLDECKFKTPRTPKTVAFHLSPTTGAPVTQVKRFIIGEAMDYIEVPSPSTTITPDTVARTEAEASDSPIEHHITHLERRRDAAILQPIFNEALPVERKETDVVDSPVSKRKINARDTIRKRKAEEARSAKAAKEAEKKAKEEEARRKRDERRMPEEKVIRPLTAEWERRVDAAMAAGDGTRLAATSAGSALSRRDLGTVLPVPGRDRAGGWLNDEVVTGYLQAVVDHGQSTTASAGRGKTPKFYAFNTFFYPSIREKGVGSVRKWAEKGRIGGRTLLEVERVFVPVHESAHWSLVVVSPVARAIEYFDSLGGSGTRHVGRVKAWLAQELGPAWVEREWAVRDSPSPRQANGLDCGVFAVTTAKMITLGIDPLAYGPEDIPVQRRRMVAELLNGGFVGDFEP